jgi:hypothetical protein
MNGPARYDELQRKVGFANLRARIVVHYIHAISDRTKSKSNRRGMRPFAIPFQEIFFSNANASLCESVRRIILAGIFFAVWASSSWPS